MVFLQAVFSGLVLLFYYGYLPVIFQLAKRGKKIPLYFLLSLPLLTLLTLVGPQKMAIWSVVFAFVHFFIPGCVVLWASYHGTTFARIFIISQLPLYILVGTIILIPELWYQNVQVLGNLFEKWLVMGEVAKEGKELAKEQGMYLIQLMPGLVLFDMGVRLLFGAYLLRLHQIRTGSQHIQFSWRGQRYVDWPIWIVVCGLILYLAAAYDFIPAFYKWAAVWVFLGCVPFYFARGLSIISFRIHKRKKELQFSPGFKLLGILLLFWLWPYLMAGAVSLGLLDTWFEFRK